MAARMCHDFMRSTMSTSPIGMHGSAYLKWNPKNLEIRTRSVEKTLEPLVTQVTTLVSQNGPVKKKKGRSKKAHVLSAAVQKATENFIERGQEIAEENPEIREDMLVAVEEVRKTGEDMGHASQEFANDPCSSVRRGAMVRAARALLSAVTRLLILADMVDVHRLLKSLNHVESDLDRIKNASSQQELLKSFDDFGKSVQELTDRAAKRQADLKDPRRRDDLAAARAVLKKNSMMLLTTSKAYVRHPELSAARENRDYACKQMCAAVNMISDVAQAAGISDVHPYERQGELAAALNELDQKIIMDPLSYNELRTRPSLEERLESIVSGAALLADSSCTRNDRREKIIQECNAVRQALQDLLTEYMENCNSKKASAIERQVICLATTSTPLPGSAATASAATNTTTSIFTPVPSTRKAEKIKRSRRVPLMQTGQKEPTPALDKAIENWYKKTRDLRRQLRKAVVDHVSDSFLETNVPLLVLIEAAKAGDETGVEEYANVYTEHANKLVEVANLACSMSNNEEGVKMVRIAAAEIETLCPEVINAARVLAARPRSKVAQENMETFKAAWVKQVQLLTEAVDDITTIDDFLAVSENHILEDVNKCVIALQEKDADTLDRTAGAIRGRASRVSNVVTAEMDNYEPGIYVDRVMNSVEVLRDQVMPNFAQKVEFAVKMLNSDTKEIDENEFIDASRLVYDGVREIRQSVLSSKSPEEIDSDTEIEYDEDTKSKSSFMTEQEDANNKSDRAMMRDLPEAERIKILQQVDEFRQEKDKLDREVAKWDDSGNDIIVLAKQMCMIMMEMTDFTRGRGPLKSTMDVINAAKKISEAGTMMDKMAKTIADQCPDSVSKKDLEAYLQRIALYCHQLNITSKVKADVQSVSGELIVSGLDSATSLITAAKNLMNAVVLTVKACYVASTKYKTNSANAPVVLWKMKAPEKKPLVRREDPSELTAKVRKGAQKKRIQPVRALNEFQELNI